MGIPSLTSSSDHPIEPPVGLREIKTIDAKIANLTPDVFKETSHLFIPNKLEVPDLKTLKEYRSIIISFQENLNTWSEQAKGKPEHENRLEAQERIFTCYKEGKSELSLKGLNLTSLPEGINHLKNLIYLDLSENNFNKLPERLDSLSQLKRIDIDGNQKHLLKAFFMAQPAEILFKMFDQLSLEDLSKIRKVNRHLREVVDNYMENVPKTSPTWKAPVNFNIEKIKGDPTSLSKSIRDLDLSQIKHFIPEDLEAFLQFSPNITNIKLPPNINNDHLKVLASPNKLQHLDLKSCKLITSAGLAHLKDLNELQHLDLTGCHQITDAGLENLEDLKELHYLNLSSSQITDPGLENLKDLKELQHLDLRGCRQITEAAKNRFRADHTACSVS